MDKRLIRDVIYRKKIKLDNYILERTTLFILAFGFIGLVLANIYVKLIIWKITITSVFAAIGSLIGYCHSKDKKEDLEIDIMILEHFERISDN